MFFSFVIPVYNRPDEIQELLESLSQQSYKNFEVIVVEDGSQKDCKEIALNFRGRLNLKYFYKKNQGQGVARNYGFSKARGDYLITLDSDVVVPDLYLEKVFQGIKRGGLDAFGGPDASHEAFSPLQKAINYSMTSVFTTGGIRGGKKHVGRFDPRGFNMGISREVYHQTGGFLFHRRSEDIELSIRIYALGFKIGLIPEAWVYHKRRSTLLQFMKQTLSFGKGRIDIFREHPKELKLVHLLPSIFTVSLLFLFALNFISYGPASILSDIGNSLLLLYIALLFVHALVKEKNIYIASLAVFTSIIQLTAYGLGLLLAAVKST